MKISLTILLIAWLQCQGQVASTTLDGTRSTAASNFHWRQVSGAAVILRTPNAVLCRIDSLKAGITLYELTCTNPFGASKDSVIVTVTGGLVYSATILNALCRTILWTDRLSWTTTSESNVGSYLVSKSTGVAYTKVTGVAAKGNSNYSYTVSRAWFSKKPQYRVQAVFKNGQLGQAVNFK